MANGRFLPPPASCVSDGEGRGVWRSVEVDCSIIHNRSTGQMKQGKKGQQRGRACLEELGMPR